MRILILSLTFLLPGLANATQINCTFTTECLHGESCQETAYNLSVSPASEKRTTFPSELGEFEVSDPLTLLSDDTGETPVIHMRSDVGEAWSGISSFGFHLLTLAPDGTATYSTHMPVLDGPIYYLGKCAQ